MEQTAISHDEIRVRSDFTFARCGVLDHFARLESDIARVLLSCGKAPSGEPFGQRLKAFRTADKTPLIAKTNLPLRDQIADSIAELLPIRADVVHAEMRLGTLQGKPVAIFVNAQHVNDMLPLARVISLDDFAAIKRKIIAIREKIVTLGRKISPASSPPPPLPGAAGDP